MKIVKVILKIILAGIVAVALLCGIFAVYSLDPVHIENPSRNTDYVWPANSMWIQMKEGISWGRYDARGYNNLNVVENPDILILGSSHMEAKNVMQDEQTASVLSEILEGKYSVYNLGISGHHFTKVCKYLPVTMELYENTPDVIIIETDTVFFEQKDVDELLQGELEATANHSSGLIALLQKLPFFRLGYHQLTGGLLDLLMPEKEDNTVTSNDSATITEKTADEASYADLFTYIDNVMSHYGTQVIIFYHPTGELNSDGTVTFDNNIGAEVFQAQCEEYGIIFVNMAEAFSEMYAEEHKVPHGFTNGEIGSGHLNANGHRCVAQELAAVIAELEEAGKLCR